MALTITPPTDEERFIARRRLDPQILMKTAETQAASAVAALESGLPGVAKIFARKAQENVAEARDLAVQGGMISPEHE